MTDQPQDYQQQQQHPVAGQPAAPVAPVKKKKRIFMWVFLAVQALFLIWIISGIAGTSNSSCQGLDQKSCEAATAVGAGIGVALIIGLWIAVDFILGVSYLIVRAARR